MPSNAACACPVCLKDADHPTAIERDGVPVLQNVIVPTREEAIGFPTHVLKMRFCERCNFVWNSAFDPGRIDYGKDYNNDAQGSGFYRAHQEERARAVARALGASPGAVVEIGCWNGEFMQAMARAGLDAPKIGFDPAYTGPDEREDGMKIHRAYFGRDSLDRIPAELAAVVSRHTIEHIAAPRPFIASLAELFSRGGAPRLFLETPDVGWTLRNDAFEDWYYEHCSLYSPTSIEYLLREFGLEGRTTGVFGDQYMWTEAARGGPRGAGRPDLAPVVFAHKAAEARFFEAWAERLRALRRAGPVAIWGAASKGVTFTLVLNRLEPGLIDAAIDLNAKKQGGFLPVTGLEIVSPEAARARGVRTVIVMNPNYFGEIEAMMGGMDWPAAALPIRETEAA